MLDLTTHFVTEIRITDITTGNRGSKWFSLIIKEKNGDETEISLFADDPDNLPKILVSNDLTVERPTFDEMECVHLWPHQLREAYENALVNTHDTFNGWGGNPDETDENRPDLGELLQTNLDHYADQLIGETGTAFDHETVLRLMKEASTTTV